MVGTARFLIQPTGDFSTDANGSDELPKTAMAPATYQMVPVGDSRPGHFDASGANCVVTLTKDGIAELWDEKNTTQMPGNQIVRKGPSAPVRFTIRGKNEGRTALIAVDENGKSLCSLIISVKKSLELTYRLYCLTDKRRTETSKVFNFLSSKALPALKKVLKQQANIDLVSNGPNAVVSFPYEFMGDPLYLNNPRYPKWPWSKSWWYHILDKPITEHNSEVTRLNIIGTPINFEYDANLGGYGYTILGNTGIGGKYSLIELINFDNSDIVSVIHEVGHALDLGHNMIPGADQHYCMLPIVGLGFRFRMLEIDVINPSAKSFR